MKLMTRMKIKNEGLSCTDVRGVCAHVYVCVCVCARAYVR
jgi:hypothetical protein